jgi:hypothetical protein
MYLENGSEPSVLTFTPSTQLGGIVNPSGLSDMSDPLSENFTYW